MGLMNNEPIKKEPWRFPHLGRRIVKTGIAVFFCLMICWLRGFSGADMSSEAAITAIVCMQPYIRDSGEYARNRFAGTLIGSFWGLLFLLMLAAFPAMGKNPVVLYLLMSVGTVFCLYGAVLIRQADTSSLAAIVFICIVIAFPEIEDPLLQAGNRFLDVLIGTGVAIGVNVFRLPRDKNRDIVFFLHTRELVPDRFSRISSAAMFRLNYLFNDGARICLVSEHAPAFFTTQMSMVRVGTPLIVMDGAAIFDMNEDRYLYMEPVPTGVSAALRTGLDKYGISYFIYTIHRDKTCVFHHGEIRELEQVVYDRMKRSPYRNYLDGEIYDPKEVVYYKIIGGRKFLAKIIVELSKNNAPEVKELRTVMRPQQITKDSYALYLYSGKSSQENAKAKLMEMLREENPALTEHEVKLGRQYSSDRDAMHLIHEVERYYEPVRNPFRRKKS